MAVSLTVCEMVSVSKKQRDHKKTGLRLFKVVEN